MSKIDITYNKETIYIDLEGIFTSIRTGQDSKVTVHLTEEQAEEIRQKLGFALQDMEK